MSAQHTIKRYSDFRKQIPISLESGATFDYTDYTNIFCKIRQHPLYEGDELIPGGVMSLEVNPVAGDTTKVEIGLTKNLTETLTRTLGVPLNRLPQLDIRFVPTSGRDFYTASESVEILDTQSHD